MILCAIPSFFPTYLKIKNSFQLFTDCPLKSARTEPTAIVYVVICFWLGILLKILQPVGWRLWKPNPLPFFTLRSKLCFDPNLKVLKTFRFWNYTWFQTCVRNIPNKTNAIKGGVNLIKRSFIDVFQQYQWTSWYFPEEGIEPQVKKAYIWLAMSALLGEMPSAADWVA